MFRGDECVSLGWCFWHRVCYGCLVCGDRRVVEGVTVEELFKEEEGANNKAKEVDEIPLCAKCVAEVVIGNDGRVDEEHLVPMALDRVEQFDGGLSRRRWEARHAGPATCGADRVVRQDTGEGGGARAPSPIYVSMHDPLGQPAFRRSPTKPIPSWMQYLPNQRSEKPAEIEPRPVSVLDDYFSPSESSVVDSDDVEELPPPVPPHKVSPVRPTPPTYTPVKMSRPFTLIAEEPVQRPSSSKLIPSGGRLTPGKHVRFNNGGGNHGPTTDSTAMLTATTAKAKSPSESSEFLEKYQQQQHYPAATSNKSTVDLPSGTLGRAASSSISPAPWLRPPSGGTHNPGSSSSTATDTSLLKWKPTTATATTTMDLPCSAEQHSIGGATGQKIQQQKKQQESQSSHREQTYASCHGGGGFYTGGGDGVSDFGAGVGGGGGGCAGKQQQQRRPATFQDQLKKMFGFV